MIPCLSEATTMPSSFAEDVANYADVGCTAMEVWLTKLENHVEHNSLADTARLVSERGMSLPVASYQGGLLLSHGEARKLHLELFRRRLELCQHFGIRTLVVAADFIEKPDAGALSRAVDALGEAARWAAAFEVTLALEFRSGRAICTSLDTALSLVHGCGEPNVGVNLDIFHFYTGPSKFEDFAGLTAERLAHVQLCDLAGVPRELASDSDRVLPGDGDFQLGPILDVLRRIGYAGHVSLELMNPLLWRTNARQVAEIALTSLRKTLGLTDAPRR